ncbi:thiamine pyrophosphate-dependent enzyme [Leifsonia sp. NPDC080035]|uniref:Thiamine pyrophosphate-dependent enzyme n=1 Tax=Leifsonia sp. NPDC080035 TaxID=3143936 RepID=A0AAU7G9U6_9MICO
MTSTILEQVSERAAEAALLRRLYRTMAAVRRLDREAVALRGRGVLPHYTGIRGREAVQVGATAALDAARDAAFPADDELGVAVALGGDAAEALAPRRTGTGGSGLRGPVAHAAGWALGAKLDRTGGCALVGLGAGAGSATEIREAVRTARAAALPIVFLSTSGRGEGAGMPVLLVDGADVTAVHQATADALEQVRAGIGPMLIDAVLPGRDAWPARDPLLLCERRLRESGTVDDAFFAQVADTADALAEQVRGRLATA